MDEENDKLDKLEKDVQKHVSSEAYSVEEKKIVDDLKLIRDASRANALEDKRSFLKQIESEKKTTSKVRKINAYLLPIGVAAALAVLAVFIFNKDGDNIFQGQSPLYEEYFEVYPELLTTRGELNIQEQEKDARLFYKAKHYDRAAESFAALYSSTNGSVYNFYAAMSNMLIENTDLAIQQLEAIKGNPDTRNIPINYYLGLAYLQKGDEENAKIAFQNPDEAFSFYKEKSAEILEKLNH